MKTFTYLRYLLLTMLFSMMSFGQADAKEAYAELTTTPVYKLTFYYDELRAERPGVTFDLNQYYQKPQWIDGKNNKLIYLVSFDPSFKDYRPTTTYQWFSGMERLTVIDGMKEYLYTSEVTYMSNMFAGVGLVGDLDFGEYPNFVTSNVTSMSGMFAGLKDVENIDLSTFDTRKVDNMDAMFESCPKLKTIDLNSFDMKHQMSGTQSMFAQCPKLTTIYVGENWTVDNVAMPYGMFEGCTSLVGGAGTKCSGQDDVYEDWKYAHIDGGSSNPGYLTGKYAAPYTVIVDGTMTFYYDTRKDKRSGTIYDVPSTGDPKWAVKSIAETVRTVVFDPSFATVRPTTTQLWFWFMGNLTEIKGMKEYLNTSETINMTGMFGGCKNLESVDLSAFDTSNVKYMSGMFQECLKMTTLDLRSFNTGKVIDMTSMFRWSSALTTIYVGWNWKTSNVTTSGGMFLDCTSLVGSMGTHFDPEHNDVEYARVDGGESSPGYMTALLPYAFIDGTKMTFYYDVSAFTRQEGTLIPIENSDAGILSMALVHIFYATEYAAVTTAVFDPSFAEFRPTHTYAWFGNMPNLKDIEGIEYLNTSEVTSMNSMFACSSDAGESRLKLLDLRKFDTHKVIDMTNMFNGCERLEVILIGDDWSTENVIESTDMFLNCYKLKGCVGTSYSASHTDAEYARADRGDSEPGYLTDRYSYTVFNNGTLTFYFDLDMESREGTIYSTNANLETPKWVDDDTSFDVTTVEFDPSFAIYKPTSTYSWFCNMENLTEIKGMDYLNTSKVIGMDRMFEECRSLEVLDLISFNTKKVNSMESMFANCASLKAIFVGEDWSTESLNVSTKMFYNCRQLVGGAGTKYDRNRIDGTYAHVDGGQSNPGYLSEAILGDVNLDGAVDVADIASIIDVMAMSSYKRTADVNRDGSVDVADIGTVIDVMAGK